MLPRLAGETGGRSREIPLPRSMIVVEARGEDDRSAEIEEQDSGEQEGAEHGWWLTTFNGLKPSGSFLQDQWFDFIIALQQAICVFPIPDLHHRDSLSHFTRLTLLPGVGCYSYSFVRRRRQCAYPTAIVSIPLGVYGSKSIRRFSIGASG